MYDNLKYKKQNYIKTLGDILNHVKIKRLIGRITKPIRAIQFDSRKVEQGDVFVAVVGTQVDGHNYIEKAIEKGAVAIVGQEFQETTVEGVEYVEVENSAEVLGMMAANYYDHPSKKLKLVGITGTNGKTTTVTLLYDLFLSMGYKAGLLSTIENKVAGQIIPATHTTPDAVELNRLLAEMVKMGCDYAFMEVSSHAIHQRRIAGVDYAGAVFTNLSHDHLDYHGTFKAYIEAKKMLFDDLPKNSFALVNIDDKRGAVMLQNTKAKKYRYSIKRLADFKAKIIDNSLLGLHLELDGVAFHGRLIGEFNAYNLLTAYAVAILLGQEKTQVLTALSALRPAEGRFDYIMNPKDRVIGIVDYAHTPDALEKVLQTINALKKDGNVITVVGCGGDRDKAKRPEMAAIAEAWSDQLILTSDNPRSENPEAIIVDMQVGLQQPEQVLSLVDRRAAIQKACQLAHKNDVILIAGKGHEKYQEIQGVKHPFDDKQILKEEFGID